MDQLDSGCSTFLADQGQTSGVLGGARKQIGDGIGQSQVGGRNSKVDAIQRSEDHSGGHVGGFSRSRSGGFGGGEHISVVAVAQKHGLFLGNQTTMDARTTLHYTAYLYIFITNYIHLFIYPWVLMFSCLTNSGKSWQGLHFGSLEGQEMDQIGQAEERLSI